MVIRRGATAETLTSVSFTRATVAAVCDIARTWQQQFGDIVSIPASLIRPLALRSTSWGDLLHDALRRVRPQTNVGRDAARDAERTIVSGLPRNGRQHRRPHRYAQSFLVFANRHCCASGGCCAHLVGKAYVRLAQLSFRGQSNGRRLGDPRAVSAHPASDLHSVLSLHLGWGGCALVSENRLVGWIGRGQRAAANDLRGNVGRDPLS